MNVPKMPERAEIDPIHDICSLLSGPESSGVFSDMRIAIDGDSQPFIVPWPMKIIFAINDEKKSIKSV